MVKHILAHKDQEEIRMRIAIDAMGGDDAPKVIVEGAVRSAKEFPDVTMILYGDREKIRLYMKEEMPNIEIVHTSEKIESDDDPVKSIRRKKEASMVLAAYAVRNGEADALFSAGNTGALLTAGLLIIGRIKGIDRPGLMVTMPALKEKNSSFQMLDVGANAESKSHNLDQYATLGTFYARFVLGKKNPRVALLNNGTEENKGNPLTKESYKLLAQNQNINFVGNLEARELLNGEADVVVTDGFTGNAVLKTIEGTALSMMSLLKESIHDGGTKGKVGALLLKDSLKGMKDTLDYSKHGGGVLFGVKAPVIKTHGSATSESVYYTIKQIREILISGVVPDLIKHFENTAEEK